jgi:hypothetical protein
MAQQTVASSTRSSTSRGNSDMSIHQSPEKIGIEAEASLVYKLTSPLPKTSNPDDSMDKSKKDQADSKADESSHDTSVEKKIDELKSTMELLITTLATLTTKEETQKANKILDQSLIEMKKEILEKQMGTFGDINSKFDAKICEIETKLLSAKKKDETQD